MFESPSVCTSGMHILKQGAMNPTITISINIVCTPEQLELVDAFTHELQQVLSATGVASPVTTRTPGKPPIDVADVLRGTHVLVNGVDDVERWGVYRPEPES